MNRSTILSLLCFPLLCLSFLGCSEKQQTSDRDPKGVVSGVVTLDEDPLAGAKITVYELPSLGETEARDVEANESGRYNLPGLTPGRYRATVVKTGTPSKYANPKTSGLDFEVGEKNTSHAFKLESPSMAEEIIEKAKNEAKPTLPVTGFSKVFRDQQTHYVLQIRNVLGINLTQVKCVLQYVDGAVKLTEGQKPKVVSLPFKPGVWKTKTLQQIQFGKGVAPQQLQLKGTAIATLDTAMEFQIDLKIPDPKDMPPWPIR